MRAFTLALCAAAVLSPLTATAAAKASAGSAAMVIRQRASALA